MKYSEMIEGLQIFAKYQERGLEEFINGADHDIIWACTAEIDDDAPKALDEWGDPILVDSRISPEDAKRLEELGWFISTEYAEAWSHFC